MDNGVVFERKQEKYEFVDPSYFNKKEKTMGKKKK
jgi:hypothetical protein